MARVRSGRAEAVTVERADLLDQLRSVQTCRDLNYLESGL